MALPFIIKENDTRPVYIATLLDDAVAVDITTATTVKFKMRDANAVDPVEPKVDGTMVVSNAPGGIVSYTWVAGDTDTPGDYNVEIEVTWGDGGIQTFPNASYGAVQVVEDLD